MAWGYIRIAIFTSAFLVGLHVFDSSSRPTTSSTGSNGRVRAAGESVEIRCVDDHFTLVKGKVAPLPNVQSTGM